jgi:signal transduction histidine kinase
VTSEAAGGTAFTTVKSLRPAASPTRARVLVVEDDLIAAIDLCIRLPRLGYDVIGHATTAAGALSIAAHWPPEVVLLDAKLASEADTARRLFEQFDASIVYLPKPIVADTLRNTLAHAVRDRHTSHFLCGRHETRGRAPEQAPVPNLAQINDQLAAKTLELQRALHAKDSFVAGVSHELRTPLTSILGYTDVLLMGVPGTLNSHQQKHLMTIQRNSEHLLSLLNDLLDLAKLNAGPVEMAVESVNCREIFEETVASFEPLASSKELSLEAQPPEPHLMARADRRALRQILFNLIGNAVKFTERGSVRITCQAALDGERQYVSWEVQDTGAGLSPDKMRTLFRPFVRASGGGPEQPGSGLGLYVSQRLAEQMHGSIRVASTPGVGSRFTLVLPA